MADEAAHEAAVLALPPGFGAGGEEELRTVEGVDQHRHLGLDQGLQVVLQHRHDVVQTFDDGTVDPVRGQLRGKIIGFKI